MKANIATPNANPNVGNGVVGNWVSNIYFVGPDHYWVQAGWVDGDGVWSPPPQPDGRRFPPYPTVPTSYKEMKTPSGWYDFVPYSAQPLNFARTYECVSFWWSEFGQWGWRIIIAGQNRGEYLGFPRKTRVKAASEVAGSVDNPDSAAFTSVQYKGDYSYMPFDQNSREQDAPFLAPHGSITWTSNSQYTTHANGL